MRPFFQGSIDTFCAAYAVLNALQITHKIKGQDARALFNHLVLTLSRDVTVFTRVLTLKTDYQAMTDIFFQICAKAYSFKVESPFANVHPQTEAEAEKIKIDFWDTLEDYLAPDNNRTAIFQFEKRLPLAANPIFAHWTTAWQVEGNQLMLFDCSPELHSVKFLERDKALFHRTVEYSGEYYLINPYTLRLIEKV